LNKHNPKFDFRSLKARVNIGSVLFAYGLDAGLQRKKHLLHGPCPLHRGDNPTAFRVDLARGLWRCFTACGGGDTVELVRRIENCSYAQAARKMLLLAQGPTPSEYQAATFSIDNSKDRVFSPFTKRVPLNPRIPFLQENKKISVEIARRFDAGVTDRSPFLRGTVAVRLHDLYGKPLGYCGRRLEPEQIARWGKWRFPKNYPKKETLFNAHRAISSRKNGIVVVECPWAAMRFTQAGVANAVALLGTTVSKAQVAWLSKAPTVLLMLDGDPAGQKAAPNIAMALRGSARVVFHHLSNGMEPEDLSDRQLSRITQMHLFSF